jgi:FMN reductase
MSGSVLVLSGSPTTASRTAALSGHIAERLRADGHRVHVVRARELPAAALLSGDTTNPAIADVLDELDRADGVVVASPVYKAAYTGLLKTVLDLLPQTALAGKVVLPVVTGGTPAHVLAIDYALRPVLSALGAHHVMQGWFVLDRDIEWSESGVAVGPASAVPLYRVVDDFSATLSRLVNSRASLVVAD